MRKINIRSGLLSVIFLCFGSVKPSSEYIQRSMHCVAYAVERAGQNVRYARAGSEYKEAYQKIAEEAHATMRLLLQNGGDPNEMSLHPNYDFYRYDRCHEVTALAESVKYEDLEGMRILLEARADVNKKSAGNKTPLHIAVDVQNLEAINLLLRYGANPNEKSKDYNTPLEYAKVVKSSREIIDALLRAQQR